MNFLKKRETPVQNISYIGIMAAVNVVFVLISSFLPILFILLVFILPLTSVIVTIYCKKAYFPVYFVTTLALTFAVTSGFSVFDTFIYVLPSLITGFIFGLLIEKGISAIYILVINSIVQYLLTYLTFYVLDNLITHVNFFDSIYNLVGLSYFEFKGVLTNIFIYIIAQIQVLLTYILVRYEVNRIGIEINLKCENRFILYLVVLVFGLLTLFSALFFPSWATIFTLIILPIIFFELIELVMKIKPWIYVLLGVSLFASIFLFAFLTKYVQAPNQLVLLYVFFAFITIIDFIVNYCFKPKVEHIQ